jgi:transposase InsO family protein
MCLGERRHPFWLTAFYRRVLQTERANPTDGTRMVAALTAGELGAAVNRKRVQRLMREHQLLQPSAPRAADGGGYFEVRRPDEPWHMDMTTIWVAEHGWTYLNAAIDAAPARSPDRRLTSAAAPTRRSPSSTPPSLSAASAPGR